VAKDGEARKGSQEHTQQLRERLVRDLRGQIASGAIPPGERIVERDIAARFGTSRGPVREALRSLEHEGLVESTPYAGVCVTKLDAAEVDVIVALRRQVEYFAIASAALRADPAACERLRSTARDMRRAYEEGDFIRCVELDMTFHLGICEASGHKTLIATMKTLLPRLGSMWYPDLEAGRLTPDALVDEHMALADAVAERDVDAALRAIDEHIDTFYRHEVIRLERLSMAEPDRPTSRLIRPQVVGRTFGGEPVET
jgi:DNA-binding GntR family transcriptional regulator